MVNLPLCVPDQIHTILCNHDRRMTGDRYPSSLTKFPLGRTLQMVRGHQLLKCICPVASNAPGYSARQMKLISAGTEAKHADGVRGIRAIRTCVHEMISPPIRTSNMQYMITMSSKPRRRIQSPWYALRSREGKQYCHAPMFFIRRILPRLAVIACVWLLSPGRSPMRSLRSPDLSAVGVEIEVPLLHDEVQYIKQHGQRISMQGRMQPARRTGHR